MQNLKKTQMGQIHTTTSINNDKEKKIGKNTEAQKNTFSKPSLIAICIQHCTQQ